VLAHQHSPPQVSKKKKGKKERKKEKKKDPRLGMDHLVLMR